MKRQYISLSQRWDSLDRSQKNLCLETAAVISIIVVALIFFWRTVFLGRVLVPFDVLKNAPPWNYGLGIVPMWNNLLSDPVHLYFPWRTYLSQAFSQRFMPLWNPYSFSGVPFIANSQTAVFYPLSWLVFLLTVPRGTSWLIIISVMLAGIFMYAFLRTISVSREGALLGGLVFMFNGFFIAWLEFPTFLSTGIWLPLILLFTEKTIQTRRPLYAILTGASLAVMTLGGHIQILYFVALAWVFYVAFRVIWEAVKSEDRMRFVLKMAALMIVAAVLWVSLAAIQLLPTYEFSNEIVRAKESYESIIGGAMPMTSLATLVFPDFYGNQVGGGAFVGAGNYTEYCNYIGILPLLFGVLAVFMKKDKYSWLFIVLGLGALLLAFGAPLYKVLYYLVPRFNQMRGANRFIYLYAFSGAALAGIALDKIIRSVKSGDYGGLKKSINRFTIGHWAIGLALLPIAFMTLKYRFHQHLGVLATNLLNALGPWHFLKGFVIGVFFYGAAMLLLFLVARKRIKLQAFWATCLILVLVDLFLFAQSYNTQYDMRDINLKPPLIGFLQKNQGYSRMIRATGGGVFNVLPPNNGIVFNLYDTQGSDTYIYSRYVKFLSVIEDQQQSAFMNNIHNLEKTSSLKSPLLDVLNVKYIMANTRIKTDLPLVYEREADVYENTDFLPRAYLVEKTKILAGENKVLAEIASANVSFRDTAYLTEKPVWDLKTSDLSAKRGLKSKVGIAKYRPNEISLEVSAPKRAFLVLSEVYYPGWRAYVDGKETKLYQTDYILRGVCVNSGEHNVVFRYEPKLFKIGLIISSCAAVIVLASLVLIFIFHNRGRFHKAGK